MKKRYFVLLALFCLFMVPKNVFAKSYSIAPTKATFNRSDSSVSTITSFELKPIDSVFFYRFHSSSNTSVNRIIWQYSSIPDLKPNTTYDVTFSIYAPNIGVANSNGLNGSHPLVSFSGMHCDVDYLSSTYNSSVTYSQVFPVVCRNVEVNDSPQISVLSPSTSANSSSLFLDSDAYYGVSASINFIVHSETNDSLSDAIDKNTEEVKKQTEETKKNTEETKKQTETIKDSDTSDASDSANSFFGDFESDDFGLSDIVTMPLEFIKGLSSGQCNSLQLPMPFIEQTVTLPCMTSIYQTYFGTFLTLYQAISTGLISYWVCINIFALVQGFKNPDNDEVEVLDL